MRVTERAHQSVRAVVRPGDHVVDATAGNGHDTLLLARLVGPDGRVIAFDVQEEAIAVTRCRLAANGIEEGRVSFVNGSHTMLRHYVDRPVAVVMFNLGYLPGSDHAHTTTRDETLIALAEGWETLRESGILSVVCYRGHPGGAEEAAGVLEYVLTQVRILQLRAEGVRVSLGSTLPILNRTRFGAPAFEAVT